MEPTSLNDRYDVVPYLSRPYPGCHPDALAVVARLAGRPVGSPRAWRILDLGCGDGGNLLAIAASLPEATCVGVDANERALERGRALAQEAGLDVELVHGDLTALPDDLGTFDAVFVHGVWSWAGSAVRDALPFGLEKLLAPSGLLYVSYLAAPGAYLLQAARDIAQRWAASATGPAEEVAAVRTSIPTLLAATEGESAYRTQLALEAERWETRPDYLLFHDVLDPDASAHALCDVRRSLAPAGLTWLGEVRPENWWRWRSTTRVASALLDLAEGDLAEAQQHHDDATGPVFKATVFARAETGPPALVEPEAALELHISTPPNVERPEVPPSDGRTLLEAITPEPLRVADAAAAVGLSPRAGAEAALRLAATGLALLTHEPPAWTLEPGDRPRASALPRIQARMTPHVTSLRHTAVGLQHDAVRALLLLLDGTRTREELVDGLASATTDPEANRPEMQQLLEPCLELLGRMGLLLPG